MLNILVPVFNTLYIVIIIAQNHHRPRTHIIMGQDLCGRFAQHHSSWLFHQQKAQASAERNKTSFMQLIGEHIIASVSEMCENMNRDVEFDNTV